MIEKGMILFYTHSVLKKDQEEITLDIVTSNVSESFSTVGFGRLPQDLQGYKSI